jgi:hypothetical protein
MEEKHFLIDLLITHEIVVEEEDWWCREISCPEKIYGPTA